MTAYKRRKAAEQLADRLCGLLFCSHANETFLGKFMVLMIIRFLKKYEESL